MVTKNRLRRLEPILTICFALVVAASCPLLVQAQNQSGMTPLQLSIDKQRSRLSSGDTEERREGLTVLGSMHHPAASRAALPALKDPVPIIRATAVSAILALPAEDIVSNLTPLLNDKDEFVRRETAYALGMTRSNTAIPYLVDRLNTDKEAGVRGAAAVALGKIGSPTAALSLASLLDPRFGSPEPKKKQKSKKEQNPFVLRAALRSLGQIRSNVALPVLYAVLQDEKAENDVRREAAAALGMIGDKSSIAVLQSVSTGGDPYLDAAVGEALRRILRAAQPGTN